MLKSNTRIAGYSRRQLGFIGWKSCEKLLQVKLFLFTRSKIRFRKSSQNIITSKAIQDKGKISNNKPPMALRVFQLQIPIGQDPGKDDFSVNIQVLHKLQSILKLKQLPNPECVSVVRKSFDGRVRNQFQQRSFNYVVDMEFSEFQRCGGILSKSLFRKSSIERIDQEILEDQQGISFPIQEKLGKTVDPIVVVGCGPAGLFCALELSEAGVPVILFERGQAVEQRGKDIGALMVRRVLDPESNLCYGEGGAGTWSDGKLTTRIGRNSDPVLRVLQTLYRFGAPESVLRSGKPHLGTNRLVSILKKFRAQLLSQGVDIRFGSKVEEILVRNAAVCGVKLQGGSEVVSRHVVLAVGHSSREMYSHLSNIGVQLSPKPFSVGFRVEHPQELINIIKYGEDDSKLVQRGAGKVPVADYALTCNLQTEQPRQVYSFCMCPGGQVVPTSTNMDYLCINGMSFSRRNSQWANSAIVVGVDEKDWHPLIAEHGILAPVAFQEMYESKAANMGGGGLVSPVQTIPDFLNSTLSNEAPLPSSSYRLGVRSAPLHTLYHPEITKSIGDALTQFNKKMRGYICSEGLLHGVETRTSAPLRIDRHNGKCESVSVEGLYPCGEGAGYAGGIVSSAVDGLKVADALLQNLQ